MTRQRAVIHARPRSKHQADAAGWLAAGLARHGFDVAVAGFDAPQEADLVALWSWRQDKVIAAATARGTPILVMERGNLPPRLDRISCGFNGMLRNARYPSPLDRGERCRDTVSSLVKPWRPAGGRTALLIDQITGPLSLSGPFDHAWTAEVIRSLRAQGYVVRYRQHPSAQVADDLWAPEDVVVSSRSLAEDFAEAALCVTYNSSVASEAVVEGIPTIACDPVSMAWEVTSHDVSAPLLRCDRSEWLNRLAWTQWRPEELASGAAWDALGPVADALRRGDPLPGP